MLCSYLRFYGQYFDYQMPLTGNIVVECRKRDGETHAISQLIIVAMSLGLLCFFTADAMKERLFQRCQVFLFPSENRAVTCCTVTTFLVVTFCP